MDTADRILDDILACMGGGSVDPAPAKEAVDYLVYCSYRSHRERGLAAADLAKLWPQTGALMEQRYQDSVNAYADSKIRADEEARHTGRAEHDLDTFGRPLPEGA